MDDIFHDIEEDLRHDNLIKFFKTYGRYILAATAAIALLTGGFLFWQHHQDQVRMQQADAYAKALLATTEKDPTLALTEFESVAKSGGGYAGLAEFRRAALLMQTTPGSPLNPENKAKAVKIYQDLSKNTKIDTKLRHLASILLVLATLDQEDPQKLLAILGPLSVSSNPWSSVASELTALVNFKMGNIEQAEKLYKHLSEARETPESIRLRSKALLTRLKPGL